VCVSLSLSPSPYVCVWLCVYLFICWFIVYLFIYFIYLSIYLCVSLLIYLLIDWFVLLFYLLIELFYCSIYLLIDLFIYVCVHVYIGVCVYVYTCFNPKAVMLHHIPHHPLNPEIWAGEIVKLSTILLIIIPDGGSEKFWVGNCWTTQSRSEDSDGSRTQT
jgi:hypothetical protein